MGRFTIVIFTLIAIVSFTGCKKKEAVENPLTMEQIEIIGSQNAQVEQVKAEEANAVTQPVSSPRAQSEPLPPQGPYKPTSQQIQTALKNSGYYTGLIDGKVGPMTKKAIKDFQESKGLEVDGKVGLKTWGILSKYLDSASSGSGAKK